MRTQELSHTHKIGNKKFELEISNLRKEFYFWCNGMVKAVLKTQGEAFIFMEAFELGLEEALNVEVICNNCNWRGEITDLIGTGLDEKCPLCKADRKFLDFNT